MDRPRRTPFARAARTGFPFALPALGVLIAATLLPAGAAQAQSAREILTRALEANNERLSGVENVTIRQEAMGMATTTYLEKEILDGHHVLRPRQVEAGGMNLEMDDDPWELWSDPRALYVDMVDHWVLEGAGSVDGRSTWRLSLDGQHLRDAEWDEPDMGDDGEFDVDRVLLELDQDRLVPLGMELDGTMRDGGQSRPMSMSISLGDYREVQGYLHPFLTVVESDLGGDSGFTEEEIAEARQAMEEYRRALEEAPPAQREMMERMMGDRMEMFEEMLAGEGIRIEMRVQEVLVNRGPPGGS